ncbi:hypothetical protein JYK00_04195 [Thermosipho ferrireducens]|uniref:Uncharacterized protein n=1 Tax=Thermosipho ferrireducens TaxID=2571116 RepID=A0ABX7SAE3_9BACT|nr:hypothetical protein [Thermosipho ferrireducens]QTA38717.1 hypothetical protein JYK00_04195 [Thermosipho ferrireducens]
MKITIHTEILREAINHIDKICGSIEPSVRYVGFSYNRGYLTLYGTDGCLSVRIPVGKINPTTLSFNASLDILKAFLQDLSGEISLYSDGNYIVLKARSESIKLKVDTFKFTSFEDRAEHLGSIHTGSFVNDLDFVSAHLEEGSMIDIFFHDFLKMAAEHNSIICYTRREMLKFSRTLAWSVPYFSVRHIVKSFKKLPQKELHFGMGINHLVFKSKYTYNLCGENISENFTRLDLLENEIKNAFFIASSNLKMLRHFLRRSMILGKYTHVKIAGKNDKLIFYSSKNGLEYKGIIKTAVKKTFYTEVPAYFFRSVLNRIGGENIKIALGDKFLIVTTSQHKRYIFLPLL